MEPFRPRVDTLMLYDSGLPLPIISSATGVKLRTLQRWIKQYKESNGEQIYTVQARRDGWRTSAPLISQIMFQVKDNPGITARQLKEMNPSLLGKVSIRTIHRWLVNHRIIIGRKEHIRSSLNIDGSTPPCSASRTPAGPLSIASVSSEAFSPVQSPGLSSTGSSEHELLLDKDMDLKLEIKEEVVDDALREFVKVLDHVEEPPDPKEDDVDVVASTSASSSNIEFVDMIPHQMEIPSDPKEDPVDVLAVTKPSSIPSTSSVLLKKAGPAPLRVEDVDEFQLFGMFVASQLRALPLRDALQAQLEIQTLLAQKRSQRLT